MQLPVEATRRRPRASLRAWCEQCLPGRRKPGVLRPRHCRDATVFGHTTKAVHDVKCPPPPPIDSSEKTIVIVEMLPTEL